MEQPLEAAWVDLQVGGGGVSGNHQDRANGVSQVGGDSDMMAICVCTLCGGTTQQMNNSFSQYFCLGESVPSSSHSEARQFSSFPYVCGTSQADAAVLEARASKSTSIKSMYGHPNRNSWDACCRLSYSTTILLVFIARNYGDFSSWHWNSELGSPLWVWDPSPHHPQGRPPQLRHLSQSSTATGWPGDHPSPFLHPSHQSQHGCFSISLHL